MPFWLRRFLSRIDLDPDTDREGTIASIRQGVPLTPESLWLLVASAMLASIGLDTDSVAVIIGAMLISPLMGPILALGLGVAIHDRALVLASLRELGVATLASILISGAYFFLSPLSQPTLQLTARTMPTLLDVGVAFFGGVAGVVAGSRRHPGIAIPGVAIATALMPPLCTAGFGLATGNFGYLIGAFYLFFINAVFIALATVLVARLLGFQHLAPEGSAAEMRARRVVWLLGALALVPSALILVHVVSEGRLRREVQRFLDREVRSGQVVVVDWSLQWPDQSPVDLLLWRFAVSAPRPDLRVYYAGDPPVAAFSDSLTARMREYSLERVDLALTQVGVSEGRATALQQAASQRNAEAIAELRMQQALLQARLDSLEQAAASPARPAMRR